MFSNTELFPLDCEPTTTICGKSIGFCTCGRIVRQIVRGTWNGYDAFESQAYPYGCENILKLIDESDECRVIDIDSDQRSQYHHRCLGKEALTNSPPVWPP
jgi:hypothetical protein